MEVRFFQRPVAEVEATPGREGRQNKEISAAWREWLKPGGRPT
jgi:hypothetical protein